MKIAKLSTRIVGRNPEGKSRMKQKHPEFEVVSLRANGTSTLPGSPNNRRSRRANLRMDGKPAPNPLNTLLEEQ
jgi:hypothetical protein